jgi:(1->4)-alpha-D-glucan 1-alpha-D-glucosylmutase
MDRYVCIHGHFYQPPRENPWLEVIEIQDTAYPYHDWNERIMAECYAPNAVARILDAEGRIERLVNNYARIAFSFSPVLLAWLEQKNPEVYQAILDADRESVARFSGHGSALAEPWVHLLLPLANRADKVTTVAWGIRDFERRFGRESEGMWIPEGAVDTETLEVLAEQGIRFALLPPARAGRVRPIVPGDSGEKEPTDGWQNLPPEGIDPTLPYLHRLPSGRKIVLFFPDAGLSRAVTVERLLQRGDQFAERLLAACRTDRPGPRLIHLATDGESYGHHHPHGDMALATALHLLESRPEVRLTNHAEFLERVPPQHEVELIPWGTGPGDDTWGTDHNDPAGRPGRGTAWRKPLRQALDGLRDRVQAIWEPEARHLFTDPWMARNAYCDVLVARPPENQDEFLTHQARKDLDAGERSRGLGLMELSRHTLLMFTSSGWRVEDVSSAEAVQLLMSAGRVVQLAERLFGLGIEDEFLTALARVPSNLPHEHPSARQVYEQTVQPARVDWQKIGGHYAVSSLFENHPASVRLFSYQIDRSDAHTFEAGKIKLVVGHARVTSRVTLQGQAFSYGAVHFGDHNVHGGVCRFDGEEAHAARVREFESAISRVDYAELIRLIDRHFGASSYTLGTLFRDEQRRVLKNVLRAGLADTTAIYGRVYEQNLPLMRFLEHLGVPLPRAFQAAADVLFNTDLRWAFTDDEPDFHHIRALLHDAQQWNVQLDLRGLGYKFTRTLTRATERWRDQPDQVEYLNTLIEGVELARGLPFDPDLWKVQNIYFELAQSAFPTQVERALEGDEATRNWIDRFLVLGEKLRIRVEDLKKKLTDGSRQPGPAEMVRELAARRHIPGATYRLQMHRDFPFERARALVGYLRDLGISDLYTSPILQAQPGSTHGYDITDPTHVNPELGGEQGLEELSRTLREQGMGLLVDMVPNHMGIGHSSNRWWMEVLENGAASAYAHYFDIDWHPVNPDLENKVLLPVLGDHYGVVLESGQLRLHFSDGAFHLSYYDRQFPVAPRTYGEILRIRLDHLARALGEDHEHVQELRSILTALTHLPPGVRLPRDRVIERQREQRIIKRRLARLAAASHEVRAAIDASLEVFNGKVGSPASFARLDALIEAQSYRPAFWRVAMEEINYRRFFDINGLAAIKVEAAEVFQATHQVIFRLLAEGRITGLRIDHPDGLWDPTRYFRQLQEHYLLDQIQPRSKIRSPELLNREIHATLDTLAESGRPTPWPLYVVAEKILSEGEPLPPQWAIDGTTGYDFLELVNGLFVDPAGQPALERIYRELLGKKGGADIFDLPQLIHTCKMTVMTGAMASEINSLSHQLDRIAERNRRYRDFTLNNLTAALREIIACLPIYRTYQTPGEPVSPRDRQFLESAVEEARSHHPDTAESVFLFLRDTLLLRNLDQFGETDRASLIDWVMRFQQLTGPVMAKGVEDTAFYVYNRLVSLNEVGGRPDQLGVSLETFHAHNRDRARHWPHSLLASSTHDTKRSEDVRARINVLSEIPEEWEKALRSWRELHARLVARIEKRSAPSANDQYLFYQTLVGAWPAGSWDPEVVSDFRQRMVRYMEKATREAKVHTSWINPDTRYDDAVRAFVEQALPDDPEAPFYRAFLPFQKRVAFFGYLNSLGQLLLKLTCPGVPDIYQGTELWDLSLVDPDNRRPVDYGLRQRLLAEVRDQGSLGGDLVSRVGSWLENPEDGRIKLYCLWRALELRRQMPELFARGGYQPLTVTGPKSEFVCAFVRERDGERLIVAVPFHLVRLLEGQDRLPVGEAWGATRIELPEPLAGVSYRNALTGECFPAEQSLPLARVFGRVPFALLERCPAANAP